MSRVKEFIGATEVPDVVAHRANDHTIVLEPSELAFLWPCRTDPCSMLVVIRLRRLIVDFCKSSDTNPQVRYTVLTVCREANLREHARNITMSD